MLSLLTLAFAAIASATVILETFTMSVSPPPQPGGTFEITWEPTSSDEVTILLNSFLDGSTEIITTSATIATVPNTGSYLWKVPSILCGTASFSLEFQFEVPIAFSDVFTISCGSPTPITVGQTTACITTVASAPTGTNPFLVPNTDDYPYRAGEMSYISWKPTTSGKVSLVLNKAGSSTTTTIADGISNSGYFAWTPDSSLIDLSSEADAITAVPYTLQLISGSDTTASASLYVLADYYPTYFVNISSWQYPTLGQSTTIQWSPSNASSISIQVVFGAGAVPGSSNTIIIASKVPNTGSWTWDVPTTFTPGQYILSGLDGDTGAWHTTLIDITVGKVPAVLCSGVTSAPAPTTSQTSQLTTGSLTSQRRSLFSSIITTVDSYTTFTTTAAQTTPFAQILHITSCGSSIAPAYTDVVISGTTTSFLTVGCPASGSGAAASTVSPRCYSGYSTISIASGSSVCCPSAWQTSSIGQMWCYTSISSPTTTSAGATVTAQKRDLGGPQTSTIAAQNTVTLQNLVFARAGKVNGTGNNNAGSALGMSFGIVGTALVAVLGFAMMI